MSAFGRSGFDAVDRRDVRVIQGREDARLTLEPREAVRIHGKDHWQNLDRHLTSELRIPGAIDLAHPPGAQLGGDLVRSQALPDRHAAQAPEQVGPFHRRPLEELFGRGGMCQQGFDVLAQRLVLTAGFGQKCCAFARRPFQCGQTDAFDVARVPHRALIARNSHRRATAGFTRIRRITRAAIAKKWARFCHGDLAQFVVRSGRSASNAARSLRPQARSSAVGSCWMVAMARL